MAVTVGDLAVALRITTSPQDQVTEPYLSTLQRLHSWAAAEVASRAPDAPDNYADQAVVVLVGYLYDKPGAPGGSSYANAWENSGAHKPYSGGTFGAKL